MNASFVQKKPQGHYQFCGVHFIQSAEDIKQLPVDSGQEIALIGRSNSGKSSTLNALMGARMSSRSLAYVGNTPGKTRLLNLFGLDPQDEYRVMDLPGYGFAKVSHTERERWVRQFEHYLMNRQSLRGLFLIMDARHPYQKNDLEYIQFLMGEQINTCILLNKVDKLSANERQALRSQLQKKSFSPFHQVFPEILFSAKTGVGLDLAQAQLLNWLELKCP